MRLNDQIEKELLAAIRTRPSESFAFVTSGGLPHWITSEDIRKGLYIHTIQWEGRDYKIYMV